MLSIDSELRLCGVFLHMSTQLGSRERYTAGHPSQLCEFRSVGPVWQRPAMERFQSSESDSLHEIRTGQPVPGRLAHLGPASIA